MLNDEVTCQVISHVGTNTQSHKCIKAAYASQDGQTSPCPIRGYHPFLESTDPTGQINRHRKAYKRECSSKKRGMYIFGHTQKNQFPLHTISLFDI